ncbi:MAG: winged helix DNA-binding domain-containing protein [Actinomycetota bacterium]|nr:winged helix DNA-binding domain-containing protein [Actinomycetota bacterium]
MPVVTLGPVPPPARALRRVSLESARRLAVSRQRLAGKPAPADREGLLDVVRDLGCLQLDPISHVAKSHLLVTWSRLGPYDPTILDELLWQERQLFEYFAHAAAIVLTEDYPIHRFQMRRAWTSEREYSRRIRGWVKTNGGLRRNILTQLRRRGPMRSRDFEDKSQTGWESDGWTKDRNVNRMLDILWTKGNIMVVGRTGADRWWDLTERWLPEWTPRQRLGDVQAVRRSSQRSLRALGVATPKHINLHFTRFVYPNLPVVLARLQKEGVIERVEVLDAEGTAFPGEWFVHAEDLPLLERLESGDCEPRTTLLSPFDNLICDRDRTELLWNFLYRAEFYTPKAKRVYGFYALPILYGERLIGRVNVFNDRKRGRLVIDRIFAEPEAPVGRESGAEIGSALRELAEFLHADAIELIGEAPASWRRAVRSG